LPVSNRSWLSIVAEHGPGLARAFLELADRGALALT
jgi:hypothetical protein